MSQAFVTEIRPETIDASLARIFARPWVRRRVSGATAVAIKINLCDYRMAESGATTDPAVLTGLMRQIQAIAPAASIAVVENDATSVQADSLFRLLGIRKAVEQQGGRVVNVADQEWTAVPIGDGRILTDVPVPTVIRQSDLYINFAKLKTNSFTRMTGCLKNGFGLVREKRKTPYHARLGELLVDLARAMPPQLCLIDGMIAMETIGAPAFGRPKRNHVILAADDIVSADACAARLIGFSPWLVGHIRTAHRAGVGTIRYQLETDIPQFNYRNYNLQFSNVQFAVRSVIRGRVGIGV